MNKLTKFIGMILVGLPMALIMGVGDAPLGKEETHKERARKLVSDLWKHRKQIWKRLKEMYDNFEEQ